MTSTSHLTPLRAVIMDQQRLPPISYVQEVVDQSCQSNTAMTTTGAVQMNHKLPIRVSPQEICHLLNEVIHCIMKCNSPDNARMSSSATSDRPVIVRIMEMPAVNLKNLSARKAWLSTSPTSTRSDHKASGSVQSPQTAVQNIFDVICARRAVATWRPQHLTGRRRTRLVG